MLYDRKKPVKVTSVVISTQHSKDLNQDQVRELIVHILKNLYHKIFSEINNERNLY